MLKSIKYNSLVRQYRNKIYTYAWYLTKNRMDADDITQETLIRLWENIDLFKEESTKAWIMRTTHNLCMDFLRRRQKAVVRELHTFDADEEDEKTELVSLNDSPEKTAHIRIINEKIKEAIQNLPDIYRSVFVLYEIDDFKHREIADILKIPEGSVKVNLMRARRVLQRELKCYEK